MKKLYKFLPILIAPVLLTLFAHVTGSPGGKSGSIGDANVTCTQCHGGTATSQTGWITSSIPAEGYTPGETYLITATGTHNGVVKFGFELTAETAMGAKTGTLAITEASRTQLCNQNKAVTHRAAGTAPNGNSNTWTVNWTAPATDVGQIRFYAAFNAANGNGQNTGDVIYKSNLFVEVAQPGVLLSVIPDHADQGQEVTVTVNGQNTHWGTQSPIVKLRNVANAAYLISASNVEVATDTDLQATFSIPADAPIGMYDLLTDDLVLPSSFLITVINGIATNNESFTSVYPNPASDNITVESQTINTFSMFDFTGKMLIQQRIGSGINHIDISQLQPGIYMTVVEDSHKKNIQKLVIN